MMARAKSMAVDIDGNELKISVEQVSPVMAAQLLSDNQATGTCARRASTSTRRT
ncbi:hypothetical protein [Bifidobacterium callitrichos]|uniref:hypothetical protein n=1 Tax=Bifidobacterium callitrichos TaxID=762209 RepID=UPI0015E62CE7|nr:hypothetical protein [Bifidobacterium callitrichos]